MKMDRVVFDRNDFKMKSFSLVPGHNYEVLDKGKNGDEVEIAVSDDLGNVSSIAFRVTRNVFLGKRQHWVYGAVISGDNLYRQIEIKMYDDNHDLDSVEVFPQAPPIIEKLR